MSKTKFILLIPFLLLTSCKSDQYANLIVPGDADVILICGQSNASGNSPWQYLEEKNPEIYSKFTQGTNNVLISWDNVNRKGYEYFEPVKFGQGDNEAFFGPEIGIADVFSKESRTTYIIKYALGGSCLHNQWLNSHQQKGELYKNSINYFKQKIKYLKNNNVKPHIKGMFWMQGESDSFEPHNQYYENNLKALVDYYRTDLSKYCNNYFMFVDAYISNKTIWWDTNSINNAKQHVADSSPYNFVIKTNGEDDNAIDLNLKNVSNEGEDQAHYDAQSEYLLGLTAGNIIFNNI